MVEAWHDGSLGNARADLHVIWAAGTLLWNQVRACVLSTCSRGRRCGKGATRRSLSGRGGKLSESCAHCHTGLKACRSRIDPSSVCAFANWQLTCWRSKNSLIQLPVCKQHWWQADFTVRRRIEVYLEQDTVRISYLKCRVEDTDQARSTPESEAAVIEDLKWIGIKWDEGAITTCTLLAAI